MTVTAVKEVSLGSAAARALSDAAKSILQQIESDGHWCGEMQSNCTITAEYVFMRQALGIDLQHDADELVRWLLSDQNHDGSWSLGHGLEGCVSTSVEAYLALKILGISAETSALRRARNFILTAGGIAEVRVFTRIFLAMFGLLPWQAVPQLPPELILLPSYFPVNIYSFASWARATIVPLLIIVHHRPVFPLPTAISPKSDFLDELWCNPALKAIPYRQPLRELWRREGFLSWSFMFTAADIVMCHMDGISRRSPLRRYAVRKCVEWTLDHQEPSGDWGGIFPPMVNGILALYLEGFDQHDGPMKRGLEAMERFAWVDARGKRIQPCVSPVWDTILTCTALRDAGLPGHDTRLERAMQWVKDRQCTGPEGDWRISRPQIPPGGWSFEYHNSWYPDIDDTAAVVIAFVKQDPDNVGAPFLMRAVDWILAMQNRDGGWAAFDVGNDKLWLNRIPFSDMDSLCDPSTADVTGRVLEAFGCLLRYQIDDKRLGRLKRALDSATTFIAATQEPNGAWWGRWGVNHIYGTSNVLCALAYSHDSRRNSMIPRAIAWLKRQQNPDGGWGERLDSYDDTATTGQGPSTATQTAWALMGLLAHLHGSDESIGLGIRFLVASQSADDEIGASWPEPQYTGTGFPSHFYLRYDMYRHYFPMMALGRYLRSLGLPGLEELATLTSKEHVMA